ncbi:MAG: hypothetical protein LBK72_05345 [Bifidobacteriaceae bacterium]|jgi:hypothetical protein|nr:hypothetical protein [Bifidobacteriaceae bacterium]
MDEFFLAEGPASDVILGATDFELIDNRDTDRHRHDAAFLAAAVTHHTRERARLHGSDRRRLSRLAARLQDPAHRALTGPGRPAARVLGSSKPATFSHRLR